MAYATKDDMIAERSEIEVIEVTDRADPPAGVIDDTVLQRALDSASALIDGYAQAVYKVPLDPVPPLVRDLCVTIAWYRLQRGRHTEEIRKNYEDALNSLQQISNGAIALDVQGEAPQSAAAQIVTDATPRDFSRKNKEWF